jgi:ribonuclease BN (tRNA processing enzyme)
MMKIEFHGVRGTFPVSGKAFARYGGKTHCLRVVSRRGDAVIVDAGTGIRGLGEELAGAAGDGKGRGIGRLELHILLSHFHLDHVIGLPFFAPLYSPRAVINFHSPWPASVVRARLAGLMGGPYFPVPFGKTPSIKRFHKLGPAGTMMGGLKVTALQVNHPGGACAYRIDEGDTAVVIATDTEPDAGPFDRALVEFSRGAACLVYDSTFSPAELRRRRGWGHSTWLRAVRLADAAGVGLLVLSHHGPDHNDRRVGSMLVRARRLFPRVKAAREGMTLTIRPYKKKRPV